MKKSSLWLAMAAAIAAHTVFHVSSALAQDIASRIETESLLSQSDLVFSGKVVDVQFSDSTSGIPYSFVTYQVADVIAGRPDGDLVTLRFIGGRQQKGEVTRYFSVSEMPEFRAGDTDILFVKKNGSSICPLVDCTKGRFRNLDGVLANDERFAVIKPATTYTTSTRIVNTVTGATELLSNALSESPTDKSEPESSLVDLPVVKTAQFIADVKAQAKVMSHFYDGSTNFSSVSIKQPFRSPLFQEADLSATAGVAPIRPTVKTATEFDRWEESVVNKNNGNPVIQ